MKEIGWFLKKSLISRFNKNYQQKLNITLVIKLRDSKKENNLNLLMNGTVKLLFQKIAILAHKARFKWLLQQIFSLKCIFL